MTAPHFWVKGRRRWSQCGYYTTAGGAQATPRGLFCQKGAPRPVSYTHLANEMPVRHVIALCRYYGVSADYLLGLTGEER